MGHLICNFTCKTSRLHLHQFAACRFSSRPKHQFSKMGSIKDFTLRLLNAKSYIFWNFSRKVFERSALANLSIWKVRSGLFAKYAIRCRLDQESASTKPLKFRSVITRHGLCRQFAGKKLIAGNAKICRQKFWNDILSNFGYI